MQLCNAERYEKGTLHKQQFCLTLFVSLEAQYVAFIFFKLKSYFVIVWFHALQEYIHR